VLDTAIVEIAWAAADALAFPLCLSVRLPAPDCRRIDDVSVARGNVILVDHGRWVRGESPGCVDAAPTPAPCGCDDAVGESAAQAAAFAPTLAQAPLVQRGPPP